MQALFNWYRWFRKWWTNPYGLGGQHTNWSWADPPFLKWQTDPRSICMLVVVVGGPPGLVRHLRNPLLLWQTYKQKHLAQVLRACKLIININVLIKAEPLDLSFWSFLTFLHHGIEEVKRHLLSKFHKKNSKEKLVKCATEVARLHKVSIQSCTQNRPSPKVQSLSRDWI